MQKWEYKLVKIGWAKTGTNTEPEPSFERDLRDSGNDGWEAVTIVNTITTYSWARFTYC
jgi:hypothetical protein